MPGELRDRLLAAIFDGSKTATTSLLAEWEADGEPLPAAGERFAIRDSADQVVGELEVTSCFVVALGAVGEDVAADEGEGFRCLADWRVAHERFWREHVPDVAVDDTTPVVVERLRVVQRRRPPD